MATFGEVSTHRSAKHVEDDPLDATFGDGYDEGFSLLGTSARNGAEKFDSEWVLVTAGGADHSVMISRDSQTGRQKMMLLDSAAAASFKAPKGSPEPCSPKSQDAFISTAEGRISSIKADHDDAQASETVELLTMTTDDAFKGFFATELWSLLRLLGEFLPRPVYRAIVKRLRSPEEKSQSDGASSTSSQESSALHTLASLSLEARIVLFLGGLWTFRSINSQRVYDFLFVGSFVACATSCVINYATVQSPPFYDYTTDIVTAYFHLVGLHAWLFWRGFIHHKQLDNFLRSFFAYDTEFFLEQQRAITKYIKLVFRLLLGLQFILFIIGYVAFPFPAYFHWLDAGRLNLGTFEKDYTLVHASIMWGVIPQHIPTLLATTGLFFVISFLHILDVKRIKELVENPTHTLEDDSRRRYHGVTTNEGKLHLCYDLIWSVQARLNYSCTRWQWLWIHQLTYVFFQIFICISNVRTLITKAEVIDHMVVMRLFTDFFHLGFGGVGMMSCLIAPAMVTGSFFDVPASFVNGLRKRGLPTGMVSMAVPYMSLICKGYTVMGESVGTSTVARFLTMVGIFGSIYLTMMQGGA
eukprot:TRINITY_DN72065_c0_g1_i1.p1 TRINITY_DN72065_c0_g1~~TRINITY_DN72065_c0_g1_i1.p1  ORF type:complete len:583 (-),score=89.69 TRINITY_DN72065_c0_g1_i1:320-2068(-)